MTTKMRRRMSWVEQLAVLLVSIGVVLFMLRGVIAGSAPLGRGSWVDLGSAVYELDAGFGGLLFVAGGLSLFLVKPLLLLPRAPIWLIPACGAALGVALLVGRESVCLGLGPEWFFQCYFGLIGLSPVMILFGVVLLVRRSQVLQ
jgi:hypothetical protein